MQRQMLQAGLLEADQSHRSRQSPSDRSSAEVPPKKGTFYLSLSFIAFYFASFIRHVLSDGAICSLFLQAFYIFSYTPHTHTLCQIGALVHRGRGGKVRT